MTPRDNDATGNQIIALWIAFLILLAGSLIWYGGVSEAGLPVTAAAVSLLYLISLVLVPEAPRLSRGTMIFLLAMATIYLLQILPTAPLLFPYTAALRKTHGVGNLWPGTADMFYTVRTIAQVATYMLAAFFVLRLRQAGLSTSHVLTGLLCVLLLEATYGLVQVFANLKNVPFFGPRPSPDSASGTLVSPDNFGGLMAVGFIVSTVRAYSRFAWPVRRGEESGRPRWIRRLESGSAWGLGAALFAVAIVLSKSRGAALAAIGSLVLVPFIFRGRASWAGATALAVLGGLAIFVANPTGLVERFGTIDPFELSANFRWKIFVTTWLAALHQPILGFGWGTHPRAFHPFQPPSLPGQIHHAHSEYLNILFESGLVGILVMLGGMAFWFLRTWQAQKPLQGPDRTPLVVALAGAAVVAIHSIVDFDLRITSIGVVWAALLGLGAAGIRGGTARPTWPVAAISLLACVALAFLDLNPSHLKNETGPLDAGAQEANVRRWLGLSPYDQDAAWELARLSNDLRRLQTAADLWPAHPDIQREAGMTFWRNGDRIRAAKCFQREFIQEPSAVESVLEEIWSMEVPLNEYEKLLPSEAPAHAIYSALLLKHGLWIEALHAFDHGVPSVPANSLWYDYFAAHLESAGQWGIEATVRDRRLSLRSDAWAYAAAARAWLKLGGIDTALERATVASRIDPTNAQWAGLRGEILETKGDRLAAVEAFTLACALAPSELEWRLRRGLLALADKTYLAAADDLKDVVRSRPHDRRAVLGLAQALAGEGQTSGAKLLLDDWLRKEPTDGEVRALRNSLPR